MLALLLLVPMPKAEAKTKKKASKTVTVTIKNEAGIDKAVKTVHKNALKHKKMTLKIKGSKKSSEKLLEKFEKKLQMYNTYSVIINVEKGKTKKGYTSYSITKEDTKTYDYAIQYIKKVIGLRLAGYNRRADTINPDNYTNGDMEKNFNKFANHKGWEEYYNSDEPNIKGGTKTFREVYNIPEDWKEYLPDWQMFEEGKTFAELSTFQQWQIVGGLIGSGKNQVKRQYRDNCTGTASQKLKRMVDGKTKKMCYEYAKYSQTLLAQIDIHTVYQPSKVVNHAWYFAYLSDSHAETGWYIDDNNQGPEEQLSQIFDRTMNAGVYELMQCSNRKPDGLMHDAVRPTTNPKGHTYLH